MPPSRHDSHATPSVHQRPHERCGRKDAHRPQAHGQDIGRPACVHDMDRYASRGCGAADQDAAGHAGRVEPQVVGGAGLIPKPRKPGLLHAPAQGSRDPAPVLRWGTEKAHWAGLAGTAWEDF